MLLGHLKTELDAKNNLGRAAADEAEINGHHNLVEIIKAAYTKRKMDSVIAIYLSERENTLSLDLSRLTGIFLFFEDKCETQYRSSMKEGIRTAAERAKSDNIKGELVPPWCHQESPSFR